MSLEPSKNEEDEGEDGSATSLLLEEPIFGNVDHR